MSYCRLSDADIYLYEDNEGVVCFGKNGHQAYGMTKKEAIEHVNEHRINGDYVPESVDVMLQGEYIDELESQLAELQARLAWIPVSERLPEDRATILAAFKNREILTATYYEHYEGFGGVENYWHIEGWHSGEVTHWMPLPSAPKEDVEQVSSALMDSHGAAFGELAKGAE